MTKEKNRNDSENMIGRHYPPKQYTEASSSQMDPPALGTRPPPDFSSLGRSESLNIDSAQSINHTESAESSKARIFLDHSTAFDSIGIIYTDNISIALAAPIFAKILYAENSIDVVDVSSLHNDIIQMLLTFESNMASSGLGPQHVRLNLYAVAATVDDIILRTRWGQESTWSNQTMVSIFFQESWGGERFFILLSQMMASCDSFKKEIELLYYCIEFGFIGKYQIDTGSGREFIKIKEDVYKFIRNIHGHPHPELSPSWRGVTVNRGWRRSFLSTWLVAVSLLITLLIVFVTLSEVLQRKTGVVVKRIDKIIVEPLHLQQPLPAVHPSASPPLDAYDTIKTILMPQQKLGLISVLSRNGAVVIITRKKLFASAKISLCQPYPEVIKAISAAFQQFSGSITVTGFTDNWPISTQKFPNNEALSLARAEYVAQLLSVGRFDNTKVNAFGLGAATPIATNETPSGRSANRRVEIVLTPR